MRSKSTLSVLAASKHARIIAVIIIFALCVLEYFVRYSLDRPVRDVKYEAGVESERGEYTTKLRVMVFAIVFTTLVLFIR